MTSPTVLAAPRDFYCEHSPAKSRVLALLAHPDGPPCLQAVLTCRDAAAAVAAAQLLRLAAVAGALTGRQLEAADKVAAALPDAPAGSFRQALDHALHHTWPTTAPALSSWSGHDRFDWVTEEEEELPVSEVRTPSDAKLADLTGPVVRVVHMREFHLYDPAKVLAAATAAGFEPAPADELDDDDPNDLVGALMHDPDATAELPGLDVLTDAQEAHLLRPGRGQEVADWSADPVVADFGTGWRLRRSTRLRQGITPPASQTAKGPRPDFAALFPVGECDCPPGSDDECEDCDWNLTPRTAEVLRASLLQLAEDAYDAADDLGDSPVRSDDDTGGPFTRLPRMTYSLDSTWRRGIARACDDLAGDIQQGNWPEPTCAAEEIVLHLAIDDAPDHLAPLAPQHDALPRYDDDYDWDACKDLLFQDHDILWLYDSRLAAVHELSNPAPDEGKDPSSKALSWFSPFGNVTPRPLDRGFRR